MHAAVAIPAAVIQSIGVSSPCARQSLDHQPRQLQQLQQQQQETCSLQQQHLHHQRQQYQQQQGAWAAGGVGTQPLSYPYHLLPNETQQQRVSAERAQLMRRSSDPLVLAVGECAEHRGVCCGLAAPALAQAEAAVSVLLGQPAHYSPAEDSTALKVAGAAVWSAGEPAAADADSLVLDDEDLGHYRHLLLRGGRLVGAVLLGETGDAPWYLSLIRGGADVSSLRHALPFGPAFAEMTP